MIITRSMTPYGAETLEKLKRELSEHDFLEKQKWSAGYLFDLDRDLQKLRDNFPEYDGKVYDQDGKKKEEYQDFKKRNVLGAWFVDGQEYRPLKDDYPHWDGHILLDLDGKPDPIFDTIYGLLEKAKPQWMRLLKRSGSGTLHILCHTKVGEEQKNKLCFQSAFDTFSNLFVRFLHTNHITLGDDIKIDQACRKISQGMAFWNSECVLNQCNKGYDIFQTAEFFEAFQKNQDAEQKEQTANIIKVSQEAIAAAVSSQKYEFVYDTTNAVAEIWKTTAEKNHAPYRDRLAVVLGLHSLNVSEEETYKICSYGFPANHLQEVRGWYQSANAGSIVYLERNIAMLRKYLTACKIRHTIRPIIALDKTVTRLNPVKYDTLISLNADEYITGTPLKVEGILQQIFATDKDIIYLESATGTGKTELAKYLIRLGKRVCFACGRNTVLVNKFNGMDIIRCYSIHTQTADLTNKKKSLCCSLNWLANNFEKVEGDFDYIIIDEIHLTDESFRKELMLDLLGHIRNYANNKHSRTKLLLMTATPSIEVNYLDRSKTAFVKIVKQLKYSKTIIPSVAEDYQSAVNAMICDIREAVAAGKKVLICENDTKRNAVLADYFKRGGIKLVDFNRKQRHSEEVDYVLANSRIPDGYDGIAVTTYFGVGCEIKDINEWEVFFMPLQNRGFCASHIEQFANRVREKDITAHIYFHGLVNMGVADFKKVKVLDSLSRKKHEEYEKIFEQSTIAEKNIDMGEIVEALVKYIDNKEVEYDTFTFQSAMYELPLGTIISLLQNEYGWSVNGTLFGEKSVVKELKDSRKRMNEENARKFREAYKDMVREYSVPFKYKDEEKVTKKLWNIHKGIREYEREWKISGGLFDMTCEEKPAFYNEYHQEIAGYIADFGGWVLQAVAYVVEGRITQRDLVRIITRHRLIRRLGGLGMGFFTHIAAFIAQARFPFNRNTLSADNFATLTAHIAAMFQDNPQLVAEDIAKQVVKLCKKDSDGLLCLDITDYKNNIDIIGEVKRLAAAKAERKRAQNRAANKKYKKNKKKD